MQITLAQQNFPVGDIAGNAKKIISTLCYARDELHSALIIFPELALSGYSPEDLLLRTDFQQEISAALALICTQVNGITAIIGYPEKTDDKLYNSACVIAQGQIVLNYRKQYLPNYGVFDELRYFTAGDSAGVFTCNGVRFGLLICQDLWHPEPAAAAAQAGAQVLICINASPFELDKSAQREQILRMRVQEQGLPILYSHRVSAQDDLIFDGGSLVIDAAQTVCARGAFFTEQLLTVALHPQMRQPLATVLQTPLSTEAYIYNALVFSLREYVERNKFPGVLIGISGGIDSALVLAIAVDALGKERVHGVLLPSRYTSTLSIELAHALLENFAVQPMILSIEQPLESFLAVLATLGQQTTADITEQNLQARCRGTLLMALSNTTGNLVVTTSNKSEMAVGYSTLYGDMAGGFAVLKDVYKTMVYRLVQYRNSLSAQIPEAIIERPPTAELAPNQTDQDTLPPYPILDAILTAYLEQQQSIEQIIAQGFTATVVQQVIKLLHKNEYKRRQAPIGPRVTSYAFDRERRYPITW